MADIEIEKNAELRLVDSESKNKVILRTRPVKEDIELTLPNKSGTLVTDKNLREILEEQDVNLASVPIQKPKIVNTVLNGDVCDTWLKVSEYKTSDIWVGKHTDTEWQVSTNYDFTELIDKSEPVVNKYKYKPRIDIPNQFYYVRCRFISDNMMSHWSDVRYFITPEKGIKNIKIRIEEDKLTPSIGIEPLETYGDLEAPKVKSITTFIYEDKKEIYNFTKTLVLEEGHKIPVGVLVPNKDYVIKLVVELENYETQETYTTYKSLDVYVEKPFLEHYIEEGRKYVRASGFTPVNYKDTHYKTEWVLLTEGNVEIIRFETSTDLRYFDITDYVDVSQSYVVKCTFFGEAYIKNGDWFISKESELYIPSYDTIVEPLSCFVEENPDYSITLRMTPYKVKGEIPDKYEKTVITFHQQDGENYRTIFQLDTTDEIFKSELHNIELSETELNIPEHIMARVSKTIGLNINDKFFILVYKVGVSGKRTPSVRCDLVNKYKITKVEHEFNKDRCYFKINKILEENKIGNINIEGIRFYLTTRTPGVLNGKTIYGYSTDTTYERIPTNLKEDVIIPIKLKFLKPNTEFGLSYTIETDKGNYLYSDPIKDKSWDAYNYDYICKEPNAEIIGYGLEKGVKISFNGITGLLPPNENGAHTYTEVKLYKNNGELIEEFTRNNSLLNELNFTVDKLHINSNYIVTVRVGTDRVMSPSKILNFSTNNVNISIANVKGSEGNTIVTKYPTFEIYGYLVTGAIGFGSEHYSTTWKLYDSQNQIVWQVEKDTFNLNKITANVELDNNNYYTIEAVAHSRLYGDSNKVSALVYYDFTNRSIKVPDGLNNIIYGNTEGGIYGKVNDNAVSKPRFYVGNWGDEFEYRKYSNNVTGYTTHFKYLEGDRVSYKNKLFEATKEHEWKSTSNPEADPITWKYIPEDLLLPSISELADALGVAYNVIEEPFKPGDTNDFKLWSDKSPIGKLNLNSNWIKMLSPTTKRTCYVLNQCLIDDVSYNDIVSRFKEYVMIDKFTYRFGTRLYYVRISTEEEELFLQKLPANQGIDLNKNVLVCTTNVDKTNTVRIINYAKIGKIKTDTRNCGFRIVLTPIDDYSAPYNKIPSSFPMPKNQKFLYDKFTDTGYFGFMNIDEFIKPTELFTQLGVVDGNDISNVVSKWHVYYEHGRIVYRPNKPIRSGLTFEILRKLGLVFGTDMGAYHTAKKFFYKGKDVSGLFALELMNTSRFNIVSLEKNDKYPLHKVFKSDLDLYRKTIGLLNTSSVNIMYRTLTSGHKYLGYGYLNPNNTAISGTVIGPSYTDGTTIVNKNTDLHIGTKETGYDNVYPYNINTGTNIIGKNIIVDKDGVNLKSRISTFNVKDYYSEIMYTDSQDYSTYGWLPSLILV